MDRAPRLALLLAFAALAQFGCGHLCTDGARNGDETDVDCGGSCGPCAPGRGCSVGADCIAGVCSGGLCEAPSCTDGVQNGDESDVDCGGKKCELRCNTGSRCYVGTDCHTGLCGAGHVCAAATCTDRVKNGDETDVDCGGHCPRCDEGKACLGGTDCASGVCNVKKKCVAPTCDDLVKNGAETDVDCGGPACTGCHEGAICLQSSDCLYKDCLMGSCQLLAQTRLAIDGSSPVHLVLADVDKDGQLDILVAQSTDKRVQVWLRNGSGDPMFAAPLSISLPGPAAAMAVFDANADGNPDLFLVNPSESQWLLLGKGDGTFQSPATIALKPNTASGSANGAAAPALGDFDGDGVLNLAVPLRPDGFAIIPGDNKGLKSAARLVPVGLAATSLVAGRFDGDKNLDIAAILHDVNSPGAPAKLQVFLGVGDGTFKPASTIGTLPDDDNLALTSGDLDGDGALDLIASGGTFQLQSPTPYYGGGDGSFKAGMQPCSECGAPTALSARLTNSAHPDFVVGAATDHTIRIFGTQSQSMWSAPLMIGTDLGVLWFAAGSLTGAPRADLVWVTDALYLGVNHIPN